jgi:DNA-binding response OmpR family regulator
MVLIVDDDPAMRLVFERTLRSEYRRAQAENGAQALQLLYQHRPDLVLLDVTMPVMDGWETYRRLRDLTSTPVIMVTAIDTDPEVVRGLDGGVADYITKPFSPSQLAARVRAVLRRDAGARAPFTGVLSFDGGQLVIDTGRQAVIVRGKEVVLTATEFRLLEFLARHPNQVLSHDHILEQVWGVTYVGQRGCVKTYVGTLRTKIEQDPSDPAYVLARRGVGYYFDPHHAGGPGAAGAAAAV